MSDLSLNISGKIDSVTVTLYKRVSDAANQLGIPFVVVGASARDMVLHYGYAAPIQRATADIDFAIQVSSWAAFDELKRLLLAEGFSETDTQHQVKSPENIQVDLVPFGRVEDKKSNIAWPPDGNWVMSALGFQEACDNAQIIRIQDNPPVDIPVATPECITILKLIAWTDRTANLRKKDAKDIRYLFTTYEKIPFINDSLHENQELMEKYDWDIELAGAYQLGVNSKFIAKEQTYNAIKNLCNGEHKELSIETLVEEMCGQIDREFERNQELMNAFIHGFLGREDLGDE